MDVDQLSVKNVVNTQHNICKSKAFICVIFVVIV